MPVNAKSITAPLAGRRGLLRGFRNKGQPALPIIPPRRVGTLNRPQKLNTVTVEMTETIFAAVQQFNRSDEVRCVIVTGAGDKAFCAGRTSAISMRSRPCGPRHASTWMSRP